MKISYANTLTSVFLIFMVSADIFSWYPELDGFIYYLFNIPYNSFEEILVYLIIIFVALSNILYSEEKYIKAIKMVGAMLSAFLLIIAFYKIYQTLYFIYLGENIKLSSDSVSIYSYTLGRLLSLIIFSSFLLVIIFNSLKSMRNFSPRRAD